MGLCCLVSGFLGLDSLDIPLCYRAVLVLNWSSYINLDWSIKIDYCIHLSDLVVVCREKKGKRCSTKRNTVAFVGYWYREGNRDSTEHNWWNRFNFIWGTSSAWIFLLEAVCFSMLFDKTLKMLQVNAAAEVIYDLVDPTANLIFGAVIDPSLSGQVSDCVLFLDLSVFFWSDLNLCYC